MTVCVESQDSLCDIVRAYPRVLATGGGTKSSMSAPIRGAVTLDMSRVSGVVAHDPGESTVTVRAATPVRELRRLLAQHGQMLAYDPPLAYAGATIGGSVAAATAGSAAHAHGTARDSVLGVRFVDGLGVVRSGGGRVVKNAAGFDLPKLMVGSAGRLGILVELTLKVVPAPPARGTLSVDFPDLGSAVTEVRRLATSPFDIQALDLEPPGRLLLRVAGPAELMDARMGRLERFLGAKVARWEAEADEAYWQGVSELAWIAPDATVVKVATTADDVLGLNVALERMGARRRYALGGNVTWIAWPRDRTLGELDALLRTCSLLGVCLRGVPHRGLLGGDRVNPFADRITRVLDPLGRFGGD